LLRLGHQCSPTSLQTLKNDQFQCRNATIKNKYKTSWLLQLLCSGSPPTHHNYFDIAIYNIRSYYWLLITLIWCWQCLAIPPISRHFEIDYAYWVYIDKYFDGH
jgi:hypothetical protein